MSWRPVGDLAARLTRAAVLARALDAVTRDRAATHGAPEDSFARLAAVWSALLGAAVTPAQAALMLAALKVVRGWSNPGHADNWIDLAGYAACGGELSGAACGADAGSAACVDVPRPAPDPPPQAAPVIPSLLPDPPWFATVRHWDNLRPLPDGDRD